MELTEIGIPKRGMTLKEICQEAGLNAEQKGFHKALRTQPLTAVAVGCALIMTELGEAIEADREGNSMGLAEELADVIIRTCDLAWFLGIDLQDEVVCKMAANRARPNLHGKRY